MQYIKRVIGLPGDTIVIKNGEIYLNGSEEPLAEPYLAETWTEENDGMTFEVPEKCYFMLGDNRNYSEDSRYWKNPYVQREEILAKAVFRYFPFASLGFLD